MRRLDNSFSQAMRYKLFESYVQPFLTKKPTNLELFLDMGERAFWVGVDKSEGQIIRSYLNACKKLYADPAHRKELEDIFVAVLTEIEYDATYRLNEAIDSTSKEKNRIRADLIMYAALVENFARAFLTPIYYFVHVYYRAKKGGPQSPDAYVNVGVVPKIDLISSVNIEVPKIDLKSIVKGVDMRIRHGGTGHEHWTVLDDDAVEIKNIRSATGEIAEKFNLTKKELSDKLEELEKTVWAIRAAFYVFMINSEMKLPPVKPRTKLGVEHFTATFAKNRVINLATPFKWDESRSEIEIEISHIPQKVELPGRKIFMATGAYDIIQRISKVPYIYQILDTAKQLALFADDSKYKKIKVSASLRGKIIMKATYLISDLLKDVNWKQDLIQPIEGLSIDESVCLNWVGELTCPVGFKDIAVKELKKADPDAEFI